MSHPTHIDNLTQNLTEVRRLIEIHTEVAGEGAGYKSDVEVLNKSAIVLLVACWESFVEDIVSASFDFMLDNASGHGAFPSSVLTKASKKLTDAADTRKVWELAGKGWIKVLKAHKGQILSRYVEGFNTPRADNVDNLFAGVIGLNQMSSHWSWKGMSSADAKLKLSNLVTLRGSIAHRVSASEPVYKREVQDYLKFVRRLAVVTHNRTRTFIEGRVGEQPWLGYRLGQTR